MGFADASDTRRVKGGKKEWAESILPMAVFASEGPRAVAKQSIFTIKNNYEIATSLRSSQRPHALRGD